MKAQEHFLLPDSPTKCNLIKEGKFIKEGESAKKWNIVIKKDSQREYFNNNKDYIKYKIDFLDNCMYKATVTAKTDGKYPMRIGDVVTYKVLETDHQFIKIETINYNKKEEIVLEKIE
ncbi:hypothetical protein PGH12_03985 [Chryseobacterium wangxinyae]|uniref:hypothetical protein n=1 Tax=Chryseobacterium sp. CY350 TaxID=2997336 RepID=UPI002270EF4C|nr:hypothetical protein [Chryseobacterium sp. CY350]MCY0978541.1 hypothetical protein [Chryseobacterium sp. CY350]WBZ96312.1 hypothetical protein PGH12_03985 [Chryseobacterium sp. CY350]